MFRTSTLYMFAGAFLTFQVLLSHVGNQTALPGETDSAITVLMFGDSLTAAHGLALEQGFAGVVREKATRLSPVVETVIAGVSGETTAGGVRRIGWLLRRKVDILVLALGGNDGLRGIDPESTRENLQKIIDHVKASNPRAKVIIAGMEAPPNMGAKYTKSFRRVFEEVTAKNEADLIPFLLEGVAAVPELNLPDGIHPNVEGHKIVAENVWNVLRPMLEEMLALPARTGEPAGEG